MTPQRRQRDTFLPWIRLGADCAAAYGLLRLAFYFRFESGFFSKGLEEAYLPFYYTAFPLMILILIFFMRFYQLYQPTRNYTFLEEFGRVLRSVVATTLVLTAITFFLRGVSFSRSFLLIAGVAMALGLALERLLLGLVIMWIDLKRGSYRNVLVVGCNDAGRKLTRYYRANPRLSTRVTGFLDDRIPRGTPIEGVPVLGRTTDLGQLVRNQRQIHEVVLATKGVSQEAVLGMIFECEKELVSFRWVADVLGLITSKMGVSYPAGVPVLSFSESPLSDWENRLVKRTMDVVLSLAALLALSPLLAVLAVLVKLDSPGPIFYFQKRVGEDGRRFKLFKFRTMRVDADPVQSTAMRRRGRGRGGRDRDRRPSSEPEVSFEKVQGVLEATIHEPSTRLEFTAENDPRRTRIGTFLRTNNLDELPQLWNVVIGDMSLVGPRPERPFFVRRFKRDIPRYMARHTIRSGITGWAQVNGLRGNTSIEERTKYDLYYIENWSVWLDLRILFRTVFSIFSSRNAY